MPILHRAAVAFGRHNRRRKAGFARSVVAQLEVESVLLLGITGWPTPDMNRVELELAQHVPYVVASGIEENAKGWNPFVLADGRRLPFATDAFDLVYANAVIEHVGGHADQQRFMDEVARVGRAWIVTTPNRWFPVEAHYHTLFSHWRTGWAPRGTVTRLIGRRDLRALAPQAHLRGLAVISPTLTAVGQPNSGAPSRPTSHRVGASRWAPTEHVSPAPRNPGEPEPMV